MNRNKTKSSIYIRTFSALLAIYLILMAGFSVFLLMQVSMMKKMEFSSYILYVNGNIGETLQDNTDSKTGKTNISKVKKQLVNYSSFFGYSGTELALFTGDYDLIFNSNEYWLCTYTERTEGTTGYSGYGYINPEEWFSKEEAAEIENYIYAEPKAKKAGDLSGYSVGMEGFWVDNEKIIPKMITVDPLYARTLDEKGNVSSSSGASADWKIYTAKYKNTQELPYYSSGAIIPRYTNSQHDVDRIELRKMATDKDKLKKFVEQPVIGPSIQKAGLFTYRYYMAQPYKNTMKINQNNKNYSEFWVAFAREVNLLSSCTGILAMVWGICLLTFLTAAYILSVQTYKTCIRREELEKQRSYTTNALAHDLKTPLSIISGYAQNLIENIHSDKREYYADNILNNVNRMDGIIRKMLELSRIESEAFQLNYEEFSLGGVAYELKERYTGVCNEKHILSFIEGDALINADKSLIERVVDNFFVNALDNTPDGGIIRIGISDNIFEFFNSGSRIPENRISDIWQPYIKADESRGNTKGTGLGLSIARTILELHSFSYEAENIEDGVIFCFKFTDEQK